MKKQLIFLFNTLILTVASFILVIPFINVFFLEMIIYQESGIRTKWYTKFIDRKLPISDEVRT